VINPEVSIIITNYNYSRYVRECIESCINQGALLMMGVLMIV